MYWFRPTNQELYKKRFPYTYQAREKKKKNPKITGNLPGDVRGKI